MTRPPPLLLLTAAYPFGSASETFLESELPVLARRFGRVLVVPSHREPGVRPLPEGAELVEMAWLDGYSGAARRRALLSRPALRIARTTLLGDAGDARAHLAGARSYADILARNLLKARDLRAFVEEEGLQDAIAYDYWFENSTLALALLRREGRVAVAVARAHRFDLYDEEWRHGRVPFRRAKARELDRIFPVSAYGARYLEERLPGLGHKIEVARLGVPASGEDEAPAPEEGEPPTLVTCGRRPGPGPGRGRGPGPPPGLRAVVPRRPRGQPGAAPLLP